MVDPFRLEVIPVSPGRAPYAPVSSAAPKQTTASRPPTPYWNDLDLYINLWELLKVSFWIIFNGHCGLKERKKDIQRKEYICRIFID